MTSYEEKGYEIVARLDRIPTWALNYIFIGILGVGELFTFFDIFNINVSWVQTAVVLLHATPATASVLEGPVVLGNLIGYVIGSLILSPLSDRYGRRDMLVITMLITALGSLFNVFVANYIEILAARTITGIGIGADLAIVNTYVGEVAPVKARAKYVSMIFIFSTMGAFLGIWVGLLLTTPPAPFPYGLPIALGSSGIFATDGWRIMYGIGALLAFIGILLRFQLPESPRWLLSKGRMADAEKIVEHMEKRAESKGVKLPKPSIIPVNLSGTKPVPYSEIFKNRLYLKRFAFLLPMWFLAYSTVYSIAAGLTSLLTAEKYSVPEAGIISAMGVIGFVIVGPVATFLGDKLERKYWLGIGAILTVIGGVVVGLTPNIIVDIIASIVLFFGFNIWVPIAYTWTMESYPTRARTSGFALNDGLGHLGGGIGVVAITSLSLILPALELFGVISIFLVIAAVIAIVFGHYTTNRRLDEVSP
ncbi:MFS transporter [Sulfolobales archaeon HS-7]|nr:MFS transporter [Sulfolobales archaeon HS-7]